MRYCLVACLTCKTSHRPKLLLDGVLTNGGEEQQNHRRHGAFWINKENITEILRRSLNKIVINWEFLSTLYTVKSGVLKDVYCLHLQIRS